MIPVYNAVNYLSRCMESVLGQTYKNIEVICVDDGSTDGSGEMLDEYALKDDRVLVIHQDNMGPVHARKVGIARAKGDYLSYVDSDDAIASSRCEEMLPAMRMGADIILTEVVQVFGDGHKLKIRSHLSEGLYDRNKIEEKLFSRLTDTKHVFKNYIYDSPCSMVYKREFIAKVQAIVDDNIFIGEGWACTTFCLLSVNSIFVSYKGDYYYYKHSGSSCHQLYSGDQLVRLRKSENALYSHYKKILKYIYENRIAEVYTDLPSQIILQFYQNILLYDYDMLCLENDVEIFPYNVPASSRVIVYGAGSFGVQLYHWLHKYGGNIALWCDKAYRKYQSEGYSVAAPLNIKNVDFDYILLAISNYDIAMNAYSDLIKIDSSVKGKIKFMNAQSLTKERLESAFESVR